MPQPPPLTPKEKAFARRLAAGDSPAEAARKAFKWKCDVGSKTYERARTLKNSARVKNEVAKLKADMEKRQEMAQYLGAEEMDWSQLAKMAIQRLKHIRDDGTIAARHRFSAIDILEQIQDPAQDINLIWTYLDLIWDGMKAHCPCCHKSFPLWKVKNPKLAQWRRENAGDRDPAERPTTDLDRRLRLLRAADKRNSPHKSQIAFLGAPERHALGQGPARTGKSWLLAMFGYLSLLVPGVENWILARIYDDAESEMEYLNQFLTTAFYPLGDHLFKFEMDKKTGEAKITTRWGSVCKIKSSKSKGSITGRELEVCLVAEPAWVDGDLFEEVRARMSSRLGRIIAMGTPKGFGGFIGRLMRMSGRDVRTGKRLDPGARLIANGCPWGQSILLYTLKPVDNPAYVTSELEAARMELTASEYASEFEGSAVGDSGRKFPHVADDHLVTFAPIAFQRSVFVLGIDQGERNFAGVIVGWDGVTLRVSYEYFDSTDTTIKSNMITLNNESPSRIRMLGANADNWKLTIFDADPIVSNQLAEMEEEGRGWRTDITLRPKSKSDFGATWRDDTCMWLDQLACDGRLLFSAEHCDLLHEQMKDALQPHNIDQDTLSTTRKKWVINDPLRGDHVVDALLLAAWAIYSHQVIVDQSFRETYDAWEEARRAHEYRRQAEEKRELTGYANNEQIFEDVFGRDRTPGQFFLPGSPGYFDNES